MAKCLIGMDGKITRVDDKTAAICVRMETHMYVSKCAYREQERTKKGGKPDPPDHQST